MNLRCFVIGWFGCVGDFSAFHLTYLINNNNNNRISIPPVVSIWKILGPSLASMSMETWALRENSIHYRIYSHISRSTYKSTSYLCGWKNDQNAWPMYKSTPQYQVMMASFSSAHSYSTVVLYDLAVVWLAVWLSGNTLASINVVALRQTRLVLGWVTVCGRVNHLGM